MRVGIEVAGLKETLRAFNAYGPDANRELRQAAGALVDELVPVLVASAASSGPQAMLAAGTVKRISDRVPAIGAAGSKRVKPSTRPRRKVSGGDVFFGSEFGAGPTNPQFPKYTGTSGRWFFPTIRRATPALIARYNTVLEQLSDQFDRGGKE
jgi:hypothetical protein